MFTPAFGRNRDLGTAPNVYPDLHVCLRKHTFSIYLCVEGLGFRGFGLLFYLLVGSR